MNKQINMINIIKNTEEFNIGGEIFTVELSDEHLLMYSKELNTLRTDFYAEELSEARDKAIELLDIIFVEVDAGKRIYELAGKSTYVVVDILAQVINNLAEKINNKKVEKFEKYLEG